MTRITIDLGGLVLGVLGVLLVGLKLTGHIDWSWWVVLAPFWAPLVSAAVFAVLLLGLSYVLTKGR